MILLVSYDLHDQKNYKAVTEVLRSYDGIHPHGSTWVIDTEERLADVRDQLRQAGDGDDSFVVVRLRGPWATRNVPGWKEWIEGRTF